MVSRSPSLPLNQAHSLARLAEKFERDGKLIEASACHRKVIEFLELSSEISTFSCTQESIQLQIKHHYERRKLLTDKEEYLKKIKEKHLRELAGMAMNLKEDSLPWAIYQKIDEADSLIDTLSKQSKECQDENNELGTSPSHNKGTKHPKNDHTVIEELHVLNSKLRELISQLLSELQDSQKEAAELREKLKYNESGYSKKSEALEDQNLIDFSSISSSVESIGIIS